MPSGSAYCRTHCIRSSYWKLQYTAVALPSPESRQHNNFVGQKYECKKWNRPFTDLRSTGP